MEIYFDLYHAVKSIVKYCIDGFKLKYKIGETAYVQEVISVLIFILVIICNVPFMIFRKILEIILKCWHRKNYIEMLSGNDKTFVGSPAALFLNVYVIENKGTINQFYKSIREACKTLFYSHPKFSSVVENTMGYQYFISNKIKFEEIVTIVDPNKEYITKEDLSDFIDKIYSSQLQSNFGTKLWDVTILNKPIIYNKSSENKLHYAIIIKTIHTLSDAIYLSAVHQRYLFDKCDTRQFVKAFQHTQITKPKRVQNVVKYFTSSVKSCQLHGKSPKSISSVYIEENPIYLNMIKEIRNKYKVTFTQVMYAVAVHSICEYFKKKDPFTKKILYGYTLRPVNEDINRIMQGNILTNNLTFMTSVYNYPATGQTIKDKLLDVARNLEKEKDSTDAQVMYILQKLSSYLPFPLLNFFLKALLQPVTVGFTNIPAVDCASINRHDIKDGFVYVNFYQRTKFVYQIYTYDGRLQVNLTAAKHMVDSREDIDEILKRVFKNIEELHEGLNGDD